MSTLYGAVDLGKPERQEFFGELRTQIEEAQVLKKSEEALEKATMQAAGTIAPISSNGLYQRDFNAAQQMANILKESKSEMLKTEEGRAEYQRGIDEIELFLTDRKAYYSETHPQLVSLTASKKAGTNPWAESGMQDPRTLEDYVSKTAELDTNRFQVRFEGGSFILSDENGDHASNDVSLMDLSFFDQNTFLEQTDPKRPQDFFSLHRPKEDSFSKREDAVDYMESLIMTDQNGLVTRDAIRWFVDSEDNVDGLTLEDIEGSANAKERAVEAYAEASVPEDWKPTTKSSSKTKTSNTPSRVYQGATDEFNNIMSTDDNFVVQEESSSIIDPVTGNQSIIPSPKATYNFRNKAASNRPKIEFYEGMSGKMRQVTYKDQPPSWSITFDVDGGGSETIDFDRTTMSDVTGAAGQTTTYIDLFGDQWDDVYGEGTFLTFLSDLQTKAKAKVS